MVADESLRASWNGSVRRIRFGSLPRFLLGGEGELEAGVGGVWEVTGKEQGRFNY